MKKIKIFFLFLSLATIDIALAQKVSGHVKKNTSKTIKKSTDSPINFYRIGNLEIQKNDAPRQMGWNESNPNFFKNLLPAAQTDYQKLLLKEKWRLPTREELNLMNENKEMLKFEYSGYYWCSEEYDTGNAWCRWINISSGGNKPSSNWDYDAKFEAYNVRYVRTVSP